MEPEPSTSTAVSPFSSYGFEPKALIEKGCTVIDDASNLPFGQQVAVGGVSGWLVGYVSMKAGKWVLWTAGGALLCLQLAHTQGYVQVDWRKVNRQITQIKEAATANSRATNGGQSFLSKAQKFAEKHTGLTSGFIAGVLLGLGSG